MSWQTCTCDVSPEDIRKSLQFYDRHRAANSLPPGWSEDLSKIRAYAERGRPGEATMLFTNDTGKGPAKVEVNLINPGWAEVCVTDETGNGLTADEITQLCKSLLGVSNLRQVDDFRPDPATPAKRATPASPWSAAFQISPYPPKDGPTHIEWNPSD